MADEANSKSPIFTSHGDSIIQLPCSSSESNKPAASNDCNIVKNTIPLQQEDDCNIVRNTIPLKKEETASAKQEKDKEESNLFARKNPIRPPVHGGGPGQSN
ncbi:hypothetical protein M9H77_19829 [Catharanthus roseus]|uniref:Uncharacterized protein n=1 Tax=Catharanthus roseus TaxID=4058 RepID=A0ACC0BBF0_CATRO|nr:hypothetical protein M9H77_19829 [Catharanthus roseus]